jgi:hypothetical protein
VSVDELGFLAGSAIKADAWALKKGYHAVQNVGMRYQNWRHQGAGETDSAAPAAATTPPVPAKPAGKNWTTEESSEKTFIYSYEKTEKRSRS